jgi:hypothetical protein
MARRPAASACARALWLLGLTPPVDARELNVAWRARVARTHPDLHASTERKAAAAATLTRALNEAKETIADWIDRDLPWPDSADGPQVVRLDASPPEPWPERSPTPKVARPCPRTGLRAGDLIRTWPYLADEVEVVAGTEIDDDGPAWVVLEHGGAVRADRVRLASYSCPVCGLCAGPVGPAPMVRPCPDCLVDLRRLEARPAEAGRIRRAIEARAEAGLAEATALGDGIWIDRARERRRFARRLREAGPDDLHAALLAAFGRAFERWHAGAPR